MTADRMKVAYLVSQYPWPSHVFIEREVAGLRSRGVEVHTFSVRRTPESHLLGTEARREAEQTEVVLAAGDVLRSGGRLLVQRPGVLASVARSALRSGPNSARARLWQSFYLAEAARLHSQMRDRGVRHLHVHLANNSADIARLVVAIGNGMDGAGWSWSLTMHGPTEFEEVTRFDLPAKVASASAVACISDFTRSQLMRHLPPEQWSKLSVVRMSVDTDQYRFFDRSERKDVPLRLLYVGRLVPEKGSPLLIEALAQLQARGVYVDARLVGAGELHDSLRKQLVAAGLEDRAQLLGAVGQDQLPALYEWADVFCLPSFQEGLPVVLMEAMATGLPTVTTAIAGIPELVRDGVNGRVVPAGRSDLIADAIERMADDKASRLEMGSSGRVLVEEEFSIPVTATQQADFLASVVTGGRN